MTPASPSSGPSGATSSAPAAPLPPATGLLVGTTSDGRRVCISPSMANRHGLIAGATGTGKTVTLQNLAEGFARMGVPVFTADIKGDLSGLGQAGTVSPKLQERLAKMGLAGTFQPVQNTLLFWDFYGKTGHPVRTTISEMGPLLLGRLFSLNPTQQGVLEMAFRIADDQGLLLLDMKDLRALLAWMGENASDLVTRYGNVTKATLGAIQRSLLSLEGAGGDTFFAEPALAFAHLMQRDANGRGIISVLDATKLMEDARLYTTFLLWLLSDLFEQLPEVGDADRPRLVFFFDEAHLLFKDAPKSLVDKIEQVVRLIRSKGVGVYFVTQNPLDIPESILGQLGNRVQHALRAFTPRDQKAVRTAAETFRQNPKIKAAEVIMELGVGEALVSVLDPEGRPGMVERILCAPPGSKIGPISAEARNAQISGSIVKGLYDNTFDRDSAYEILKRRGTGEPEPEPEPPAAHYEAYAPAQELPPQPVTNSSRPVAMPPPLPTWSAYTGGSSAPAPATSHYPPPPPPAPPRATIRRKAPVAQYDYNPALERGEEEAPRSRRSTGGTARRTDSAADSFFKSVARSVGTQLGSSVVRGLMGSLMGKKRR
ncbi:ATP-binding protein [Verrucomicrobia bacterium LW23]|nr:ATP-binding protein [Verrucomicrobia bacterium LW23]